MSGADLMERRAVLRLLSGQWRAGPDLDDAVLPYLGTLQDDGLVERTFGDLGPAATTASKDGLTFRLSACWWFRLTAEGLRARASEVSA